MHLGNVYAFLVAWAHARKLGTVLRLRMDDLDGRCQNKDIQQQLLKDLTWLGIDWDGDVAWQSKRIELYEEVWHELQKTDLLYPCFCSRADLHAASAPHASDGTPIYAGTCKNLTEQEIAEKSKNKHPAWRIKVPNKTLTFNDEIFGLQSQNLETESGDFILRRSDGVFAYQFCNAIDDLTMGITEIVRGCDLLSSVCRELWLIDILCHPEGAKQVEGTSCKENQLTFAHIPMFVNTSHQRLAKRDKSLDLGAMQKLGMRSCDIIGEIAHLIGITEKEEPLSTKEFLSHFNIDALKSKQEIVVE